MNIILQIIDYVLKALMAYAETPAGQKELDDIQQAVRDA